MKAWIRENYPYVLLAIAVALGIYGSNWRVSRHPAAEIVWMAVVLGAGVIGLWPGRERRILHDSMSFVFFGGFAAGFWVLEHDALWAVLFGLLALFDIVSALRAYRKTKTSAAEAARSTQID